MNADFALLTERVWPWIMQNWVIVLAVAVVLILGLYARRLFGGSASRPRPRPFPAQPEERGGLPALDIATAAAAEISGDLEAYARALFTEDFSALAGRAAAGSAQPLRFAAIAEAPFIYDGVIMRDVALLPNALIAPVGNHFRQSQALFDAMRRQGALTPPDATPEERIAALQGSAQALAAAIDRATVAAEKLDAWLAKNGGTIEPLRGIADLPVPALRGAGVERVGQRTKTYRLLREQAQARLGEIDAQIAAARRSGPIAPASAPFVAPPTPFIPTPALTKATLPPATPPSFDPTIISVKPSDKTAAQ